jgi:hypothetical protein
MRARELEPRQQHLTELDDVSFLRAVRQWLRAAEREPSTLRVLAELRDDYERDIDAYHRAEEDAEMALLDLTERLDALVDPDCRRPADDGSGRVLRLIANLRPRVRQLAATTSAEAAAIERRLAQLTQEHARRHRQLIRLMHSSPEGSLRRLDWLVGELESPPRTRMLMPAAAEQSALFAAYESVQPLLRRALADPCQLTPSERRQLGHIVAAAREDADRVNAIVARQAAATERAAAGQARAHVSAQVQRQRDRCG